MIKGLLNKEAELQKELRVVQSKINEIKRNCTHDDREFIGFDRDIHEGRTYRNYKCNKCDKSWSERL